MYVFADVELDLDRYEMRRQGSAVRVEPQVLEVLAYLAAHGHRVVSKEELLDNVWGDRFVSESALTSRIKAARRAVGDDGQAQRVIATVHGRGYRLRAPVDVVGTAVCCGALTTSRPPAARSTGAARMAAIDATCEPGRPTRHASASVATGARSSSRPAARCCPQG
jgi:DNA-binding winged helix-turn-helix (wHTH) protein